jgi:hypothetical protein
MKRRGNKKIRHFLTAAYFFESGQTAELNFVFLLTAESSDPRHLSGALFL